MGPLRLDRATRPAALAGLLALGLAACGDDSGNPSPTTGSGTFTTTGTGQTTSTGGGGGGGDGGGGQGGGCTGEDGCFACEPTENDHFLDACTDSQCAPFDNEERLPLYDGGELPPVP